MALENSFTLSGSITATSAASVVFGIPQNFDNFLLFMNNVSLTTTGADYMIIQINTGSGFINTGYVNAVLSTTSGFTLFLSSIGISYLSGSFYLNNLVSASNMPNIFGTNLYYVISSGSSTTANVAGIYPNSGAVTSIQIIMTDSSAFSGNFSLYGIGSVT